MPNKIKGEGTDTGDAVKQRAISSLSSLNEEDQIKVLEYIQSLITYSKNN